MKWLVWKEYRLNRVIVVVGTVLLVLPHVVALILTWKGEAGPSLSVDVPQWSANLLVSAAYSVMLSQLTLALLGGNAIACERVDRSAEFLAYLPLSRAKILAGKLTLALSAAGLIWGVNLLILLLAVINMPELSAKHEAEGREVLWTMICYVSVTGLTFFSVGWLLSSMLESPTISACVGLVSPLLVITGIQVAAWLFAYPESEDMGRWYLGTCLVLATACFVAGTWYYLRRTEP